MTPEMKLVMAQGKSLERVARKMVDRVQYDVAGAVEKIAMQILSERGITDYKSKEAKRVVQSVEHLMVAAVIRHMTSVNDRLI